MPNFENHFYTTAINRLKAALKPGSHEATAKREGEVHAVLGLA
ncbi:MAG: hypothetical protein Kow00107_06340 [Planctomycetota bacterium]